jgi:hypothetical protein
MCDDFEDGIWYQTNCDTSGGKTNPANDGWCGTIYAEPITPQNAATCGGAGAVGTSCAANGGAHVGSTGGVNMADHDLAPNNNSYNEIFLRYYLKPSASYNYGAQKMITLNQCCAGKGGIDIGGIASPFGSEFLACPVYDCNILTFNNPQCSGGSCPSSAYLDQNVGTEIEFSSVLGRWVFIEIHVKVNTPGQQNGIYELWMDDCGTSGLGCTGTPTKRASYNNVRWQGPSDNKLIGSIWFENWANPGSTGTELYDQIKVSRVGPIGFMAIPGGPPTAPSGLTVQP